MPARIAKYPPISAVGNDFHSVLPPSTPPVPPNPALIPTYTWAMWITNPVAGYLVTGKWSWQRVTTEGLGNILAGHDWGFAQTHVPVPTLATPSIAIRTLSSSVKYWMPSSPNKEPQDGSPPGVPQKGGPVAVSTPAWVTSTEDCQDISTWGFNAPTSVSFQLVSVREVGFTLGDLAAGLINVAVDSAAALVSRAIGGKGLSEEITSEEVEAQLRGAIVGAIMGTVLGVVTAVLPVPKPVKILLSAGAALGAGDVRAAAADVGKNVTNLAGGQVGNAAQPSLTGDEHSDKAALDDTRTSLSE